MENATVSKRAMAAMEVIKAGGYFSYKLERAFRGGEKFRMRLLNARHEVVAGFGHAAHRDLQNAGMLRRAALFSSSAWEQRYVAADAPKSEAEIEVEAAHLADRGF